MKIPASAKEATTLQELLVYYVSEKNLLFTVDYADPEDLEEIYNWSDGWCEDVFENLEPEEDQDTCPWCLVHIFCESCRYGRRHGICKKDGSRYKSTLNPNYPQNRVEDYDLLIEQLVDEVIAQYHALQDAGTPGGGNS